MPNLEQIRAARALLGWSQSDLAERAGLSQTGIARIENGTNHPNSQTLSKIEQAFDQADIEFLDTTGVRKRENHFRVLKGRDGFRQFIDDVYNTLEKDGGDFCVFNADARNWSKWLSDEQWAAHNERMTKIKNRIQGKIIIRDKDDYFLARNYAEYRWFDDARHDYDEKKTLYSYGNKLAFLDFGADTVVVTIMERFEFAKGFRVIFNVAWEQAKRVSGAQAA